jgi:hypothetical protein
MLIAHSLSLSLAEELQREMVSVQWAPQISLRISNFRPGTQAKYAKYFAPKGRVVKPRAIFSPRRCRNNSKNRRRHHIGACVIN